MPLIPTAAAILDEHLAMAAPKQFIFETFRDDPGDLDYVVRKAIRPALAKAGLPWDGLQALRRGLATNLHELGIADIIIQAVLRPSDVSVTRLAYIKNDGVDPQNLAAMKILETAVCNQNATDRDNVQHDDAVN